MTCFGTRSLAICLSLSLAVQVDAAGQARSLRRVARRTLAPKSPDEIHAQYDKMDDLLKLLFSIGCKMKHQRDVQHYAEQGLKAGTATVEEFEATLQSTQDKEVVAIKSACPMIVASQMPKCRSGCAARWNTLLKQRDSCDDKCVKVYNTFEEQCTAKAEQLRSIYALTAKQVAAKKKCYDKWCPMLPNVQAMTEEAQMVEAVSTHCSKNCEEGQIELRCHQKFQLEIDFHMAEIKSQCAEEGTTKKCFDDKKGKVGEDHETCKSDGMAGCEAQLKKCESQGIKDTNAEAAQSYCDKTMQTCVDSTTAKCLKTFKSGLDALKKHCESEGKSDFDKCTGEELGKREEAAMANCDVANGKVICQEECKDKCKIGEMTTCLGNLNQPDATKDFCEDFWGLIEQATDFDRKTGDPKSLRLSYNP